MWYSMLTPEISKLEHLILAIELIASPILMRHFTIKWNEKQFKKFIFVYESIKLVYPI